MKFGYEDLDFITKIYLCSPSVVLNPKTYYVWIMRYAHSTSGKTDINNITSLMKCLENKSRLVTQTGIETQIPAFWVSAVLLLGRLCSEYVLYLFLPEGFRRLHPD